MQVTNLLNVLNEKWQLEGKSAQFCSILMKKKVKVITEMTAHGMLTLYLLKAKAFASYCTILSLNARY